MMTKDERQRNRGAAEKILAKMNEMARGRDFAKLVKEGRIDQLNCEIGRLGWLVLTKSLKVKKVSGKMELRLQLKLVDPDSEEAKAYGVQ